MAACARASLPPPAKEDQPPAEQPGDPIEAVDGAATAPSGPDEPIAITPKEPAAVTSETAAARAAGGPGAASDRTVAGAPPFEPSPDAPAPVEIDTAAPEGGPATMVDTGPGAVRVGLLVPLSGRYAPAGETLLRAAQLALFDSADEDFTLLPRDTGGTALGAEGAALALLEAGVDLILGPLFADGVAAVASQTRGRGVAVLAFSTDRAVAGDGVYLLGHTPRAQIRRVIAHAAERGHRRVALLAPETRYGAAVADETAAAARSAGLSLIRVRHYAPDSSDAAEVVRDLAEYDRRSRALEAERTALAGRDDDVSRRRLKRLSKRDTVGAVPFDALLLADGGARLRQIVPLLPYYDIDPAKVRLLGTGLWEDPATLGEPTLVGGWFAGPGPAGRRDFEARYRRIFGEPPGVIASLAYDATALAAVLARAGLAFGPRSIDDRRGFLGVDGLFRFDEDGMAERSLAVFEVAEGGEAIVISPAPERFDPATDGTDGDGSGST